MLANKWEGASSPLQLSGWLVTHVENDTAAEGALARVFWVIRTAAMRFPSRCKGGCGSTAFTLDGRESKKDALRIFDAPAAGRSVIWRIRRTRVRCRGCARYDVEELPLYVDLHSGMTARAYIHMRRQAASKPYLAVAQEMGISRSVIRWMMTERFERVREMRESQRPRPPVKPTDEEGLPIRKVVDGRPWVGETRVPRYLGLDEVAMIDRRFPREAHLKKLRAVLFDLESGGLVDFMLDNGKPTIAAWFAGLEVWERSRIKAVAIDMNADYRATIRAALGDHVPIVVDRFHLDAMAQAAADAVRRAEVKVRSKGRKSSGDPEVRKFARMLRRKRLPTTLESRNELRDYLRAHPLTYYALLARQDFREIFDEAQNSAEGQERLHAWRVGLDPVIRPAFAQVERNLDKFGREILAFFDVGITNSMTESGNGLIKRMSRAGPSIYLETIRDKMLMRRRFRPATALLCDGCGSSDEDCIEQAGPGAGPSGTAGRIVCVPCLHGHGKVRRRIHRPSERLHELFIPGQRADNPRPLSRREAVRRRGEQIAMVLGEVKDAPVIRPQDLLLIKPAVRQRPERRVERANIDVAPEVVIEGEPLIPVDLVA